MLTENILWWAEDLKDATGFYLFFEETTTYLLLGWCVLWWHDKVYFKFSACLQGR